MDLDFYESAPPWCAVVADCRLRPGPAVHAPSRCTPGADSQRNGRLEQLSQLPTLTEAPIVGCKYGRTVPVKPGRQLFAVRDKTSWPAGFIPVEAEKPVHLVVDGAANAGRRCKIEFVSVFATGARYVIKGGIVENPETYDSCQVKIFNEDTGAPLLMLEPSTLKNDCALDKLPSTAR